jgi:hypothetical protein
VFVHPVWHLVPIGFVSLLIVLAIQSWVRDDARFGWGMFKKHVDYRVSYAWVLEDGSVEPYSPTGELRGPGWRLRDDRERWTSYSVGALRSWVRGYARYMVKRDPRAEATLFRAVLTYRINRDGDTFREVIELPRTGP